MRNQNSKLYIGNYIVRSIYCNLYVPEYTPILFKGRSVVAKYSLSNSQRDAVCTHIREYRDNDKISDKRQNNNTTINSILQTIINKIDLYILSTSYSIRQLEKNLVESNIR